LRLKKNIENLVVANISRRDPDIGSDAGPFEEGSTEMITRCKLVYDRRIAK
jgi:hypothetical protein